jgi:hypothetical protein
MRKLYLNVFLISWMVMLSAVPCGAYTQPKSLMGSAGASWLANRPMKEGMGSDEQ